LADLLLPLEGRGLPFHFSAGEGPVIERPVRTRDDIANLRTDRAGELGYVSEGVGLVAKHFGERLPVIGFCGAPFTLASYMIEGGGSRNYVHAKKMMYNSPEEWDELMRKLVAVTAEYSAAQVRAGADAIQVFDSWVGCLSVDDYRRYVLAHVTDLVKRLQKSKVPVIYFGTDSATLLPAMKETGAEVIGLDWRIPLDEGWRSLEHSCAVQGNLDPVLLFAEWKDLKSRAEDILQRAGGRPGHIFNLGHGILPETPASGVRRPEAVHRKPEAVAHETDRCHRRRYFRTIRCLRPRRTSPQLERRARIHAVRIVVTVGWSAPHGADRWLHRRGGAGFVHHREAVGR
jgi:uroporphyrinogen decarboxylase